MAYKWRSSCLIIILSYYHLVLSYSSSLIVSAWEQVRLSSVSMNWGFLLSNIKNFYEICSMKTQYYTLCAIFQLSIQNWTWNPRLWWIDDLVPHLLSWILTRLFSFWEQNYLYWDCTAFYFMFLQMNLNKTCPTVL